MNSFTDRTARWSLRLAGLVIFLILAGTVFFYSAGPFLLEKIVISQLRSAGIVDPEIKFDAITHKGLHFSQFSAQKPQVDIDFIKITYTLGNLVQGRVDDIIISGLHYRVKYADNQLDHGLPDRESAQNTQPVALPFNRLSVGSSAIVLNFRNRDYKVPFMATVRVKQDQVLEFSARPVVWGLPVNIEGHTRLDTFETVVRGESSWADYLGPGREFFSHGGTETSKNKTGHARVNFDWTIDSQGRGKGSLDVSAGVQDLHVDAGNFKSGLDFGEFHLKALINDEARFDFFDAEFLTSGLYFNEYLVSVFDFSLKENASVFNLISNLEKPLKADFEIRGKQSSINDLFENRLSYESLMDWDLSLEAVPQYLNEFIPIDLELSKALGIDAQGQAQMGFFPEHESAQEKWFAVLSMDQINLDPVIIELPSYGLTLKDVFFTGSGNVEVGPAGLNAELSEKSSLGSSEVIYGSKDAGYRVRGIKLSPELLFSMDKEGVKNISGAVEVAEAFSAGGKDFSLMGNSFSMDWDLSLDPYSQAKGLVRMESDISQFAVPELGLEIRGAAFDIPLALGRSLAQEGSFSIKSILYNDEVWPGIKGSADIVDHKVSVQGKWPFLPDAQMDFFSEIILDKNKDLSGNIMAETGWFSLPEKDFLHKLMPELEGVDLDGNLKVDLSMDLAGLDLSPHLRLGFKDVNLSYEDMDLEVFDAAGEVNINSFSPLTTPGNQRIDVSRLRIGLLELVDGFSTFRVESAESFFLERTRWNLPEGGFIAAHSSRFNLDAGSADLELFFEDIDIIGLVSKLSEEKIAGNGLVYGRVPLIYEDDRITLGNGYLYSVPGTGKLGIKDEQWLEALLSYVRDAMAGHEYLATVSERLEQALQDFEYNYLTINIRQGLLGTSARIELRGKGVEGDPPQEVGSLVINVNDLEEIVN
ncbi:MAG: YdbH domain-containing protein, partial [Desulfonatronovibrio sp.]